MPFVFMQYYSTAIRKAVSSKGQASTHKVLTEFNASLVFHIFRW